MNKLWWRAAAIRSCKTICQTAIAMIGTTAFLEEVNWIAVASASALAGILSLLTSLAGLPEVDMAVAQSSQDAPEFDEAIEPEEQDREQKEPEEGVM